MDYNGTSINITMLVGLWDQRDLLIRLIDFKPWSDERSIYIQSTISYWSYF